MKNNTISNKIIYWLATGFTTGYLNTFSETLGSLYGIGAYYAVKNLDTGLQTLIFTGFTFLAIGVSEKVERIERSKDPKHIIIDETAGMWISLLFINNINLSALITAFVIYRFFSNVKPFPLNLFQGFNGGVGIIADNLAAGMLTNFILRLLIIQGVF